MYRAIFLIFVVLITSTEAVNLTAGGNFSFEFPYYPGACPKVSPYLLPCNKTLSEGRWFAKYVSYTEQESKELSCFSWDLFVMPNGTVYNFIKPFQSDLPRTITTVSTPMPGREHGVYLLDAGVQRNDSNVVSTLFYTDGEMLVFWDTVCYYDNSRHTRNGLISYRDLSLVRDKEPQTRRIMKMIEKYAGGPIDFHPVRHSNCHYPPQMKNPFT